MKRKICNLIIVAIISILFSIIAHETVHVIQDKLYGEEVKEVCFLGYDFEGLEGAGGWVTSVGGRGDYYAMDEFSWSNLWKYMSQKEERLPMIIGFIIAILIGISLSYYLNNIQLNSYILEYNHA